MFSSEPENIGEATCAPVGAQVGHRACHGDRSVAAPIQLTADR